jgi:hypothetical protein
MLFVDQSTHLYAVFFFTFRFGDGILGKFITALIFGYFDEAKEHTL